MHKLTLDAHYAFIMSIKISNVLRKRMTTVQMVDVEYWSHSNCLSVMVVIDMQQLMDIIMSFLFDVCSLQNRYPFPDEKLFL